VRPRPLLIISVCAVCATSDGLKEIIRACLVPDPSKRLGAHTLLAHPYFDSRHERLVSLLFFIHSLLLSHQADDVSSNSLSRERQRKRWLKKPFLKCSLLKMVDIDALLAGSPGPSAADANSESETYAQKFLFHFFLFSSTKFSDFGPGGK